jgi:hypothetical protein
MFIGDTSARSKASRLPFIETTEVLQYLFICPIWTQRKHPKPDRNPLSKCTDYVQVRLYLRRCEHLISIAAANIRQVH